MDEEIRESGKDSDWFLGTPEMVCERGRHWKVFPGGVKLLEGGCNCPGSPDYPKI